MSVERIRTGKGGIHSGHLLETRGAHAGVKDEQEAVPHHTICLRPRQAGQGQISNDNGITHGMTRTTIDKRRRVQ